MTSAPSTQQPLWWAGVACSVLGVGATYVALSFIQLALNTVLSMGLMLIANMLWAWLLNGERPKLHPEGSMLVLVSAGTLLATCSAKKQTSQMDIYDVTDKFATLPAALFLTVLVTGLLLSYRCIWDFTSDAWVARSTQEEDAHNPEMTFFEKLSRRMFPRKDLAMHPTGRVAFAAFVAIVQTLSLTASTATANLLRTTIDGDNQAKFLYTWMFVVACVASAVLIPFYISEAMARVEALTFVPANLVIKCFLVLACSAFVWQEFSGESWEHQGMFWVGSFIMLAGVVVTYGRREVREEEESEKHAETVFPMKPLSSEQTPLRIGVSSTPGGSVGGILPNFVHGIPRKDLNTFDLYNSSGY
eukprot:CAMPEP_0114252684 /NCGR_PEP_ID=MMETSP0058-20121206/15971_1 /TAXON_ID=36894 /ORGANISM="Pyramimonas parkeae, CCMP726" /LENGTH=359 /DNA_ID=CAMNT_0001366641 /DNA_START=331 /DNA_END=1409 /DNA_ORIENTATION=-